MAISENKLAAYLEYLAKETMTVSYSDLQEYSDLPPLSPENRWQNSPLCKHFSALDSADKAAGRPLRTSMVVLKCSGKIPYPGNGYFKSLRKYRGIELPVTASEKREVHKAELDRLFVYYRDKAVESD